MTGGFAAASFLLLRELPEPTTDRATVPARARRAGPPAVAGAPVEPGADHVFDTVIVGGRVMDPDSGFDEVTNVGIDGATVLDCLVMESGRLNCLVASEQPTGWGFGDAALDVARDFRVDLSGAPAVGHRVRIRIRLNSQ